MTLRVLRDDTAELSVRVERQGGFSGAVEVVVEGLPAGVGAGPITLQSAEDEADVTVTALTTASPGGPTEITVRAVALEDDGIFDQASVDLYLAAAPGAADRTFGETNDGIVTQIVTDREFDVVRDVAIDSQGRIVVAGVGQDAVDPWQGFALRLTPAGELDDEFSSDGIVDDFVLPESDVSNVVLTGDAPIFSAVSVDGGTVTCYLRKLTSIGQVDTKYGTGGDVDLGDACADDLLKWGGGLLVYADFAVLPFNANGGPDSSFDVSTAPGVLRPAVDGQKRVLYGDVMPSGPFIVGRITASGAPDESFAINGVARFAMSGSYVDYVPRRFATYPDDGGVMLAEARALGGDIYQQRGVLVRFDEAGAPDEGFGTDGLAVVTEEGFVADMIVQNDGKIVVLYANRVDAGPTVAYAMARFEVAGSLDTSFGDAGILDVEEVYAGNPDSITYDAAAGRLIVGGSSDSGIALMRLWL